MTGQMESYFKYKNGKREGPFYVYFPLGYNSNSLSHTGSFKNGVKSGLFKTYSEPNKLSHVVYYKNGKLKNILDYKDGFATLTIKEGEKIIQSNMNFLRTEMCGYFRDRLNKSETLIDREQKASCEYTQPIVIFR